VRESFATFLLGICDSSGVSQRQAQAGAPAAGQTSRLPSKIEAVGIVISAHNQAGTIAKCIHGLFAANSHTGWHNSLWIVVVSDACTDDTAKLARSALGAFGQVLEVSARSPQTAHRIGASAILDHFHDVPRHALLLASTDADMDLRRDWIENQVRLSNTPIGLSNTA
jgi:glycosyltransferase involved in cell wall biosynthesis